MSNITTIDQNQLKTLEQAGIIPPNTPPAQVAVFAQVCKEKGLSPFSKEAHLVGYGGKYSVIVGINGLRKIAAQTGALAGSDDARYNETNEGKYYTAAELAAAGKKPLTCTVTVYRMIGGQRCPFTHTAVFSEFAGSGKWQTMPFQMIAKVAEAFALRKGFADVTGGVFVEEEGVAIADEQEHSPLHQKREQLREIMLSLYTEPRVIADYNEKIDNATLADLGRLYYDIKENAPVSPNPAEQFVQMQNKLYGRNTKPVKNPTV